jgi:hypothetical protein
VAKKQDPKKTIKTPPSEQASSPESAQSSSADSVKAAHSSTSEQQSVTPKETDLPSTSNLAPEVEPTPEREPPLSLTGSVLDTQERLAGEEAITSWDVVRTLFGIHPEYGKEKAKELADKDLPLDHKLRFEQWVELARSAINPAYSGALHGRLFILALCALESELLAFLQEKGFYTALVEELEEPVRELLVGVDPRLIHADSPSDADHLGRQGFAEALALWIDRLWWKSPDERTQSVIFNLHGPWGSGKSSLLRLLRNAFQANRLEEAASEPEPDGSKRPKEPWVRISEKKVKKDWVIVEFNAWQRQHLEPVWWPLMDEIYRGTAAQEANTWRRWWFRVREFLWRASSQHLRLMVTTGLVAVLALLFLIGGKLLGDRVADSIEAVSSWVAALGSIATVLLGALNAVTFGTAESGQSYLKMTRDPHDRIRKRFQRVAAWIDRPIIVFIDDLDRCQPQYVVNLLEGIHTVLSHGRVFYLVAGDRRWISRCFEVGYPDFRNLDTSGRLIGYKFLEKTFQLVLPVPHMTPEDRVGFLDYLHDAGKIHKELQTEVKEKQQNFKGKDSNEVVKDLIQPSRDAREGLVRRIAAVLESTSETSEKQILYTLRRFEDLIEPNPRAMKRLVNAYGIYQSLAFFQNPEVLSDATRQDQFALWIIACHRWPAFMEWLEDHPEAADALFVGEPRPEGCPEVFDPLWKSEQVRALFAGGKLKRPPLTSEAIRRIGGLMSEELGSASTLGGGE